MTQINTTITAFLPPSPTGSDAGLPARVGRFAGRRQLVPPIARRQRALERVRTAGLRHERHGTADHVAGLRARERFAAGIREFEHGELDRRELERRELERRRLEFRRLQQPVESLCRQCQRQFVDGGGELGESKRRERRQHEDTVEPEQFLVGGPVGTKPINPEPINPKPINPESIDEFRVDPRDQLFAVDRGNVRSNEFTKLDRRTDERLGTSGQWHGGAERGGERRAKRNRFREPDHAVRVGPITAVHLGRRQFNDESQDKRLVLGHRPESAGRGAHRSRASLDAIAAATGRRGRKQIRREVGTREDRSKFFFFFDAVGRRLEPHGGARRVKRARRGGDCDDADNATRDRPALGGSARFHGRCRRSTGP